MSWDSATTYREGLGFFTDVVDGVATDDWKRPSPCAGWTAQDVAGHVGQAADMGARILRGETFTPEWVDPPGGNIEGDPGSWWATRATAAAEALEAADDLDREVDSPMGRRSIREGLSFPAVDLFIHGWDLATATGQMVAIPDEATSFVMALFDKVPTEVARSARVFADPVAVPDNASPTARLMGFCGRDPNWTA